MECKIEGCTKNTESINRLCLVHECRVWHDVNQTLKAEQAAADRSA